MSKRRLASGIASVAAVTGMLAAGPAAAGPVKDACNETGLSGSAGTFAALNRAVFETIVRPVNERVEPYDGALEQASGKGNPPHVAMAGLGIASAGALAAIDAACGVEGGDSRR